MKDTKKLTIFKWWLCWHLIDLVPKSWGTKFGTYRYSIFKVLFEGFENYIYWYSSKW